MATKKNYRRKRVKRRGGRRRYKKRGYTMKVMKGVGFIAPRLITRMKYTDNLTISTLPTVMSLYEFRLNSVYDPNLTGTGHQPYGFDQLANLYLRYRVFACKWIIQIPPTSDALHIAVLPVNGATAVTSFTQVAEYPKAMVKSCSSSTNTTYFKGKCYLPRLGGDKRAEYKSDDRFGAVVTTNPIEDMRLQYYQYNPSPSATVNTRFFITLVYYTEFYDPILQAQS